MSNAVGRKYINTILTFQDVNKILMLFADYEEPVEPFGGQIWLDRNTNCIKRWNTVVWQEIGLPSVTILNRLKDVDGSGSGLDADLLDNQEGSYYQKAAFWADSSGETQNVYIQTGQTAIPAAATTISFPFAFTALKTVVASSYTNNASNAYFIHLRNFTTTSFRATCFDNTGAIVATTVSWIAIGRRD